MPKHSRIVVLFCASLLVSACVSEPNDLKGPPKPPRGYRSETALRIAYGLGRLELINTEPEVPDQIEVIRNIEYRRIDSRSLQLDIYRLRNLHEPRPVMIFIHGGSWRSGERADYLPYLIDYARKGFVTATVSYRLINEAPFPAAVEDVNCAVRWIAEHASEYGIDPDRMVLIGGSAGAHLAMMVAYAGDEPIFNHDCDAAGRSNVAAVINLYGPVDLTTPYARTSYQVVDFLNATYDEDPGLFALASPRSFISRDDPPTLIFHGTLDSVVPVSQADLLNQLLGEAGVPHDYHRLVGWPHTMDLAVEVNQYVQYYIDQFLDEHL